jgi:hypothetical protein
VKELQHTANGIERPLLQVALEGLTGMHGCKWKASESLLPEHGIELVIPELQQALREGLELPIEQWHQLNICGLQPQHYVKVGNGSLVPRRQRNQKLVKWLKTNGWRIDLMSMDNLFATFLAHSHYFTIHWSKESRTFTVLDSLANRTKQVHNEAMILLWPILLASARMEGNLWVTEPVLMLSESQVLGEFQKLLLHRPRRERGTPLTEREKGNLRRMGIKVQENTENVTGAWTWNRDPSFPQQSNGNDCGMVAVVTVLCIARRWQLPYMNEAILNHYRQWLVQVISTDSEDVFKVPCHRCGTTQYCKQVRTMTCGDKQRCDAARELLQDTVVCEDQVGGRQETPGDKRPTTEVQLMLGNQQPDMDSETASIVQLQVPQATGVDEMSIDTPTSSDKVTTPGPAPEAQGPAARDYGSGARKDRKKEVTAAGHRSATLGTKGVGTHTPAPCNARVTNTNQIEPSQTPNGDVYRKEQSPLQEQGPKRQKLLTEGLVVSIPNQQPGGQSTRKAHNPKQKTPPRTKCVQNDTSCTKWVCNLLGAKRGKQGRVSEGKDIPEVCAECSRQLLDDKTQARCSRCRIPRYCTNTCKAIHWTKEHWTACVPGHTWCPA